MVTTYDLLKLNLCFMNDASLTCNIPGWSIYNHTANDMNFRYANVFYINEANSEIIIASINAKRNILHDSMLCIEMFKNKELLDGNLEGIFYNLEIRAIREIIATLSDYQHYKYYFTGYFYNAIIAEVNQFILSQSLQIDAQAITFNSAGSAHIIMSLDSTIKLPLANIVIYNTTPNIVNVYNPQSGKVFLCDPIFDHVKDNHYINIHGLHRSFGYIEELIDQASGEFKNKQYIDRWPYLTIDMKSILNPIINEADIYCADPFSSSYYSRLDNKLNAEYHYQQTQKAWSIFVNLDSERVKIYDHFMIATGLDSLLKKYDLID